MESLSEFDRQVNILNSVLSYITGIGLKNTISCSFAFSSAGKNSDKSEQSELIDSNAGCEGLHCYYVTNKLDCRFYRIILLFLLTFFMCGLPYRESTEVFVDK